MVLWLRNLIVSVVVLFTLGAILGFSPLLRETRASSVSMSVTITLCGNGSVDGAETCDDGANNNHYGSSILGRYCNSTCDGWAAYCGDSTIQASNGEECDDGNNTASDGCSATCQTEEEEETPPVSPGGGGGGGGGGALTQVILQGIAYPLAKITVLKDGQVLASSVLVDAQANFKIALTTITPGAYTFGVWAEDKVGRKSITFSFTATVLDGMTTTIGGIFLPPTIELDKVNLSPGEALKILGQTAPGSGISIHIESPQTIIKMTTSTAVGDWAYFLDTSPLEEGSHTARAKAESSAGLLSSFSKVLGFYIGKYGTGQICGRADFNKDNKTNLVDFSVMLYWWGKYNPCADQNQDGMVNLPDFSILMYWWTG